MSRFCLRCRDLYDAAVAADIRLDVLIKPDALRCCGGVGFSPVRTGNAGQAAKIVARTHVGSNPGQHKAEVTQRQWRCSATLRSRAASVPLAVPPVGASVFRGTDGGEGEREAPGLATEKE